MRAFYKPWKGEKYRTGGLLIISESAYLWQEEDLSPNHPTDNTVKYWAFERFENRGPEGPYAAAVTRALCGEQSPSLERRQEEWSKVAYTIYVQHRLEGRKHRPKPSHFSDAEKVFLELIERLRPGRVVITSYTTWGNMPPCAISPSKYFGAYRLSDDSLVWCMAVPHPRSSVAGKNWQEMSRRIKDFQRQDLPPKYDPKLVTMEWQ